MLPYLQSAAARSVAGLLLAFSSAVASTQLAPGPPDDSSKSINNLEQSAPPIYDADTVVVTTTRTGTSAFRLPASVTTTTSSQVAERSIATTADARAEEQGIMVQKTTQLPCRNLVLRLSYR